MKEKFKAFYFIWPLALTLGVATVDAAIRTDSDFSVKWAKEKASLTASVEKELRTVGLSATNSFFIGGPSPELRRFFKDHVVKEDLRI